MDRHVYAWHMNGDPVAGFPVLVVDPSKVQSIDPATHQITFNANAGSEQQGAIVDTPAVGDLDGATSGPQALPEIVVGTNEEYDGDSDGGANADLINSGLYAAASSAGILSPGNSRLYAIERNGRRRLEPEPQQCASAPVGPRRSALVSDRASAGRRGGDHRIAGDRPCELPVGWPGREDHRDARRRFLLRPQSERSVLLRPGRERQRPRTQLGDPRRKPSEIRPHHDLRGRSPRLREPGRNRHRPQRARAGDRADPLARHRRQRVPGRPGLRDGLGRLHRAAPRRLAADRQRPAVPHRPGRRRHRWPARRRGDRRHRLLRPLRRQQRRPAA